MNFQLKYRGQSFDRHTVIPTETVREIRFRGRTTLVSSMSQPADSSPADVQFFGWHAAGLALA